MFWNPRLIFIHVPRTGGTMLTDAFGALPLVSKEVHYYKHAPASRARSITGCPNAKMIAIYRSDEDIAESFYRMVKDYDFSKYHKLVTEEWDKEAVRLASLSFEEFLKQPNVPKLSQFVDTPDVEVVSWDQAYEICCEVFQARPELQRARFVTALDNK